MFHRLISDRPSLGIVASMTGFTASLLALLAQLSVVIGFLGALFGLAAGYYTWRLKREHWRRMSEALAPAREVHKKAKAAALKVYKTAVEDIREINEN